jgi:RNA polymerase sigma-70 factor, ECF subfamily
VSDATESPEMLLRRARAGDGAARGRLLELYRNYLRLMARAVIGRSLRVRLDESDLVQETFLQAHRDFDHFLGASEPELAAWLRQVLVHRMTDQAKYHRAQARDPGRQEALEDVLARSSAAVQRALVAPTSSPSVGAARREEAVLLADALARLPEDYREVFVLRNLEHQPFAEVAERMGRSVNAVQKLWARALAALKRELEGNI